MYVLFNTGDLVGRLVAGTHPLWSSFNPGRKHLGSRRQLRTTSTSGADSQQWHSTNEGTGLGTARQQTPLLLSLSLSGAATGSSPPPPPPTVFSLAAARVLFIPAILLGNVVLPSGHRLHALDWFAADGLAAAVVAALGLSNGWLGYVPTPLLSLSLQRELCLRQ
jgi:hypothetical protein